MVNKLIQGHHTVRPEEDRGHWGTAIFKGKIEEKPSAELGTWCHGRQGGESSQNLGEVNNVNSHQLPESATPVTLVNWFGLRIIDFPSNPVFPGIVQAPGLSFLIQRAIVMSDWICPAFHTALLWGLRNITCQLLSKVLVSGLLYPLKIYQEPK